jgi:hypothetical protein
MGFIHHTTDAAQATGLMADSVRQQGSVMFTHPALLAIDSLCLPLSAMPVGGYPFCLRRPPASLSRPPDNRAREARAKLRRTCTVGVQSLRKLAMAGATPEFHPPRHSAERACAATVPQTGHQAADPIPPIRRHVVTGQEH